MCRKNIGKALLTKNHDSYVDICTLDTSNKENEWVLFLGHVLC